MFYFLIFIFSVSSQIIEIDDFNSYKNTRDFLGEWQSRTKNYKKILKRNPYYYYIDNEKKCLCSSLRWNPKTNEKIDTDKHIPSVSVYKNYWRKKIKLNDFHKKGQTVYLEWDWMAKKLPSGADESVRELDDNVLAIYTIYYIGWLRFRSIKYLWSSSKNRGAVERYKKEENKRAYVVRNSNDKLDVWYKESINLSEHIKDFLPSNYEDISIVGIAVMSDTDNIKKSSFGCIDNIRLVIK